MTTPDVEKYRQYLLACWKVSTPLFATWLAGLLERDRFSAEASSCQRCTGEHAIAPKQKIFGGSDVGSSEMTAQHHRKSGGTCLRCLSAVGLAQRHVFGLVGLLHPGHAVLLTAPHQRSPPEVQDMVPVCPNSLGIGRHRVVREVTGDHRSQPWTLLGQAVVASSPHLVLDLPQCRTQDDF